MTKKSNFTALTSVPSGAYFDFVSGGTNYRISYADLLDSLNVSAAISPGRFALGYVSGSDAVTASQNVPVKIAGTWTAVETDLTTISSDGRFTYTGTDDITARISVSGIISWIASGEIVTVSLYKNGSLITGSSTKVITDIWSGAPYSIEWVEDLVAGDYLEVWVNWNASGSKDIITLITQMSIDYGNHTHSSVTGGIKQAGAVTGVPVLDPQGAVNYIRNLEVASTSGLSASVSAQNGITLALNAQVASGTGVAVLDGSNKIRNIKAGTGIALSISGDDIVVTATGAVGSQLTDNITAFAGGGQDDAVELTTKYNRITTCATAGDSVKLPTAVAELERTIINAGDEVLYVWPGGGDSINELAINTPIQVGVNGTVQLYCIDADKWVHL